MGSKQLYKERMAPGSSSMLRSRRRDVNVKPNRVLDRNSSRGMIYENEELRLRTININAEVERGQNDIKKLRRENDQLRKEIWALREEYDRLEDLLKSKEKESEEAEESEDEESDEKDDADQENASNQQKVAKDSDMLSVVEEEPEDNSTEGEEKQQETQTQSTMPPIMSFYGNNGLPPPLIPSPFLHSTNIGDAQLNTGEGIPVVQNNIPVYQPGFGMPGTPFPHSSMQRIFPQDLDHFLRSCCQGPAVPSVIEVTSPVNGVPPPPSVIKREGEIQEPPPPTPPEPQSSTTQPIGTQGIQQMTSELAADGGASDQSNVNNINITNDLRCEPYAGQVPAYLRLNCVQPHTLYFPVTNSSLNDLTVQEVIDSMSEQLSTQLLGSLKGVRLIGGACYLSLGSDEDVQEIMKLPLKLRGISLQLEDASAGAMYIALSGVPHDVSDDSVANTLAHFGTVIGGVERRLYRGVDTGERLTRLRPKLAIPRTIWIAGCRVCLRVMRPDEVSALALVRRKSFRSHLHVRLRPLQEDGLPQTQPAPPIPPLPVTTATTSVTQSVPNLAPLITEPAPPIGFSCTQSVPDLTIRPPPPDPPPKPKPQFFSSSSANNVFLFPTPCPDPKRHGSANPPLQLPGTIQLPQTSVPQSGRSHSTPPANQPQTSPLPRQTSQSDSETPKPPSPSTSKLQRQRSSRKSSRNNSPIETRKQNGDASSSSGQESPTKPTRRRVSVYFKRNGSLKRGTSMDQTDGTAGELTTTTTCSERERSNSDVSSRTSGGGCRRKMSSTGRENAKVPWCGCWGNGCI